MPVGYVEQKTAPVFEERTALEGAHDWNLLVDYDHSQIVFPPEITATHNALTLSSVSEASQSSFD